MSTHSRLGKMPSWQRYFVIAGMLICSMSGIFYLLGHEFNIYRRLFATHSVLAWHGISALLAAMALGSVLPFHLKAGLKSRRKLWSGLAQLSFLCILMVTATLLYYGSEEAREVAIKIHYYVGLTFFAIFLIHVPKKVSG